MVLNSSMFNTQEYKVQIEGKIKQFRERIAPFPTPSCSSYWKGSLLVTLDYSRHLYFIYVDFLISIWFLLILENREKLQPIKLTEYTQFFSLKHKTHTHTHIYIYIYKYIYIYGHQLTYLWWRLFVILLCYWHLVLKWLIYIFICIFIFFIYVDDYL